MKERESVPDANGIVWFGFIVAILEVPLILLWAGATPYMIVLHAENHSEELLLKHVLVAFNFIGAVALFMAVEKYKAFQLIRDSRPKPSGERQIALKGDIGYLGSWAAAFFTTLVTDTCHIALLFCMESAVREEAGWKLQISIGFYGLTMTVLQIIWSVVTLCDIYVCGHKTKKMSRL